MTITGWTRVGIFAGLIATSFATRSAFAETSRRRKLADTYVEDQQKRRSVFHAAPINHIVPAFNTITYALQVDQRRVEIEPDDMSNFANTYEEKLKLGGYTISPYVALSLRHIGIGFSLEAGRRTVEYNQSYGMGLTGNQETPPPDSQQASELADSADAGFSQSNTQLSILNYRAIGVYMYLIPFPQLKDQKMTLTLIIGARNYLCSHKVGSTFSTSTGNETFNNGDSKTYPYTVTSYEAGLNLIYRWTKYLSVVPWGQYYYADTKTIELLTELDTNSLPSKNLEDDIQILWHDRPQFEYGLDFGLKIQRLELRIGGAIGALAAYGAGSRYVHDRSISAALSYDMKGD